MPVIVNTPDGPVVVNELTGDVYGPQTQAALAGGLTEHSPIPDAGGPNIDTGPGGGTGTGPLGPLPGVPVDAQDLKLVGKDPQGNQIWSYRSPDGTLNYAVVSPSDYQTPDASGAGPGGVSPTSIFNQQQANARDASSLAEQQRQFNEQFGFNKAKYNQDYALSQGQTLLGLGSRPDTLTRYLYAIRGQLPPQALGGQGVTLPGFPSLFATPQTTPQTQPQTTPVAPQGASPALGPTPSSLVPPSPIPITNPAVVPGLVGQTQSQALASPTFQQQVNANAYNRTVAPGQTASAVGPGGIAIYSNQPGVPSVAPTITNTNPAFDPTKVPGYDPVMRERALNGGGGLYIPGKQYAAGGVIPEPVMGQGMVSGQPYTFGEKGPETVTPATQDYAGNPQPDIMDIVKMFMDKGKSGHAAFGKQLAMMLMSGKSTQTSDMGNGYADGGTIGYDPSLFNPASLPGIVNRGYNSTPEVPLLPSVGIATGGTSLIPSSQRFNSLLPSEQQTYSGFLTDEAGVQPNDVYALAQKLAPKVSGLTTPRYS